MGNLIVTLKNMIKNPQGTSEGGTWGLSNASYAIQDNRYCICLNGNGITAMTTQSLDYQPIANHKYYGRITYKTGAGHTNGDNRFEWFNNDDGTNMIFEYKGDTGGVWVTKSRIESRAAFNGGDYFIRNFIVNGNNNCYVTDMMLIDLSVTFGLGNEPTISWCDQNIPFIVDIGYLSYTDTYVKVNGNWQQATFIYVKVNGEWKELNNPIQNGVSNIYKKVNGVWVNTI